MAIVVVRSRNRTDFVDPLQHLPHEQRIFAIGYFRIEAEIV